MNWRLSQIFSPLSIHPINRSCELHRAPAFSRSRPSFLPCRCPVSAELPTPTRVMSRFGVITPLRRCLRAFKAGAIASWHAQRSAHRLIRSPAQLLAKYRQMRRMRHVLRVLTDAILRSSTRRASTCALASSQCLPAPAHAAAQ